MNTEGSQRDSETETKHLTEVILKGDEEQAARSAEEMSRERSEVNDLVDAISDAMNIVADLHEVGRYSVEQVERCEKAAERALTALRPKIRVEQTRISGRVMVASLKDDPHSFDKTLLMAMLEIGGFTPLDGGSDMSPQEIVQKVDELDPDILAVPLVTESAAKNLLETSHLISSNRIKPHIVVYGRGASSLSRQEGFGIVEEDSISVLSRIAELLISKN
ncbi:MAG: B12-binding domain-containing protein [Thermoproteota archaeon]